ncbi:MAG: hypothetical protein JWP48_3933 [Actinoallomurus sp.]|jgi:hypothetical protein|nr:hypothetical protein [Actinoallomurus sp.]
MTSFAIASPVVLIGLLQWLMPALSGHSTWPVRPRG